MAKLKRIISVSVCLTLFNLMACGADLNLPPANNDKVTSSSNSKYSYSLPLEVNLEGECNAGIKTQFSVNESGQFIYNTITSMHDGNKASNFVTVQLSETQVNELKELMKELNIAKLAEEDKAVPADAPQTEECRTVQVFKLKVNDKIRAFDQYGRNFIHSEKYRDALQKLNDKLESFKTGNFNPYSYSLPLRVIHEGECDMGDKTVFDIKEDGTFTFFKDEAKQVNESRKLSAAELNQLKILINEVNIALHAETDKPVPADAPQTKECRTVEKYFLSVNGKEKAFDLNSRNLIHSEAYKTSLEKLKKGIESLRDGTFASSGYTYSLPLKLTLDGECGMGSKTIYTVNKDGTFTYDKNENLDFGEQQPDTLSKKLSGEQVKELNTLIEQLDIAKLAEDDKAVPSDAGQTADCRVAEKFTMTVNGSEKNYLMNDRKAIHSEEYMNALEKLRDKLDGYKNECEASKNIFNGYKTADVVITMERTPCFGFCPTYKLEVSGSGKVVFTGYRNTKVEGKAETTITAEKVQQLIREFERAGYFCLDDEYTDQNVTDLPGAVTSIKINGQAKTINHYHGDRSAPNALKELEDRIDEIVNTSQWIQQ